MMKKRRIGGWKGSLPTLSRNTTKKKAISIRKGRKNCKRNGKRSCRRKKKWARKNYA